MVTAFIALLAVLGLLAFVVGIMLWRAFVLKILWGWFIMPFFGLNELTYPFAIGIALIISFLTQPNTDKIKDEYKKKGYNALAEAPLAPAFALLIGWIVTWFM